jgi:hypothetical protein
MPTRIELVARRQPDLHGGHPDYFVVAGEQHVGRIYQTHLSSTSDNWWWGINGLTVDLSIGAVMHGHAASLEDALPKLRAAFDLWLVWARAMPVTDLKHRALVEELSAMGAA